MSSLFAQDVQSPRKAGGLFVNTQNILLNSRRDSRDIVSLFVDALIGYKACEIERTVRWLDA